MDIGQNALAWRELPIDAASTQSMKKSNMKKQRTAKHGMTTLTDAPTEPSQRLVCTLVPFLLILPILPSKRVSRHDGEFRV